MRRRFRPDRLFETVCWQLIAARICQQSRIRIIILRNREVEENSADKNLFHSVPGLLRLPVGSLTSQLFGNITHGQLHDQYMRRTLKVKHSGRYVDDFYRA